MTVLCVEEVAAGARTRVGKMNRQRASGRGHSGLGAPGWASALHE